MRSERGQATVEWVGLVLLVALVLGAVLTRARDVEQRDARGVGDLVAERIALAGSVPLGRSGELRVPASLERGATAPLRGSGELRVPPAPGQGGTAPPLIPLRARDGLRAGARRVVALNGLVCYLRKSTAGDDTNRVGDDIGDAVNCLNPVGGWTGEVGGTDDK